MFQEELKLLWEIHRELLRGQQMTDTATDNILTPETKAFIRGEMKQVFDTVATQADEFAFELRRANDEHGALVLQAFANTVRRSANSWLKEMEFRDAGP